MTERYAPTPRASARRLRPSGSEDAPRGRGLAHLGALVLAVPATVLLLLLHGVAGGLGLYSVTLVALYAASVTYHLGSWSAPVRRRLRQLDYAMIPLYIAGCMTPYCLLGVPGTVSSVVLGFAWFGAAAAVLGTVFRFEATRRLISTGYLALGWLPAVTLPEAINRLSPTEVFLLVAAGLLYTAGAAVLATKWPDPDPEVFGYHEVWHTMVVVASGCYFALVWSLAVARH